MLALKNLIRNRAGQGLVEYGLVIAGVALICAAAVSLFGHQTNDLISAVATIIPGAHADDNNPITSGKLVETTNDANGGIVLDAAGIAAKTDGNRLDENVLGAAATTDGTSDGFGGLILE